MKFGIITYLPHKENKDEYYSYAPYISEMNMWLKNIVKTLVAAPKTPGFPTQIETAYSESEIEFYQIPGMNFTNPENIVASLRNFPAVIVGVWKVMKRADHLHLRCPGNVSLIGCFLQIFFPRKPKTAKYAGNWDPEARQPWSYKLQKWLLSNTFLTRNMEVLVYGDWPGQSKNVKPFFTASFSEREKNEVRDKKFEAPFTFLFVGNLVEGKRPLEAIKIVEKLNFSERRGMDSDSEISADFDSQNRSSDRFFLTIYGDGPERERLEEYCRRKDLENLIHFKGNRPLQELKNAYQKAHFLILPSRSEGWPKAIAEGMFFGCIPIATSVSCVPWMLGGGSRGILLKNQQPVRIGQEVEKILKLLADQEKMKMMSDGAKEWSQKYTLEKFEAALKEVLKTSNGKSISPKGRDLGVGCE
ncbi:glycosyltransferase family 4 protein [Salinimicrobium sp. TH3]|uniref:glycosyltransferase family 4 protein n=1 Tax=Salinimicrobium sp. TH3 TaxID=2997342 RepID=UPI002274D9E8|nr:glycosyltransferase [Salinimicrobium sp. TH3]MCY2687872.1 glycosyltransferase [Salinimicrobium sp. TH3]